jgi:hypothetical protein
VNRASAGDTINVKAGSVTWTGSTIAVSKALSIVGPGQGALTITDSQCQMFSFTETVVGSLTRLSGFTINNTQSPACAVLKALGTCTLSGCPNLRVDHITFDGFAGVCCSGNNNSYGLTAVSNMFGVFDHNVINGSSASLGYLHLCQYNLGNFMGQGSHGDYSWNQPENYGSGQFMFFENNTFNDAGCCENEGHVNGDYTDVGGGRVVIRFNTINSDAWNGGMTWHGTETNGRGRGGRAFEFYANTITCGRVEGYNCASNVGVRSGTGLGWGNSENMSAGTINGVIAYNTYRAFANIDWGACDGSSVWDTNDGTTYYSGTVGSYDSSTHTITVSGSANWSANYWTPGNGPRPVAGAPYSVHDVTKNTGSEIIGSGSNTLRINVGGGGPGDWAPAVGDSIQILRATACIDQGGGRGAGILYSGLSGNNPASPIGSSAQVSSPTYVWANAWIGGTPGGYVSSSTARVIENRDWYQDNINQTAQTNSSSPFTGNPSTGPGMGYGTLANRPSTCSKGVGYWAEDNGSWNTSNTPIPGTPGYKQGQLYLCTASNTWTLSYTPFAYPHPLITGSSTATAGNPPNPPSGLVATVQ